jgi:hypothetical protein
MAPKKLIPSTADDNDPAVHLAPLFAQTAQVEAYLHQAAQVGMADAALVTHLAKVSALFPGTLPGAFQAFLDRRIGSS